MSDGTLQRLQKELAQIKREPPPLRTAEPTDDRNLFVWKATIKGPPDSPYKGGVFKRTIDIPKEYPFSPPDIRFVTKIYHPNVDKSGRICLDVLRPSEWTPATTINCVMVSLCALMSFKETAVAWTKKYPTPE